VGTKLQTFPYEGVDDELIREEGMGDMFVIAFAVVIGMIIIGLISVVVEESISSRED